MKKYILFINIMILSFISIQANAQNRPAGHRPERSSLNLNINARVFDSEKIIIWEQTQGQATIPGRPVGIKLLGSNVVVEVQFTPFIRRSGNVLVAQGQIWIEDPEKGISYYTSIQTIPMEFDEPIHFFPLGTSQNLEASIEIVITINRNEELGIRNEE